MRKHSDKARFCSDKSSKYSSKPTEVGHKGVITPLTLIPEKSPSRNEDPPKFIAYIPTILLPTFM